VWDVRHQNGLIAPPGSYQARLRAGDATRTQPVTVRIDPRVAADGVTEADLREQFAHNLRMRTLVGDADAVVSRLRAAQKEPATAKRVEAIAAKMLTEPVRYGKPGLQAHITYLAGMTTGADQKIGRDAIERYQTLRKELDAIRTELDQVIGLSREPARE
jgi:hypothetical protein